MNTLKRLRKASLPKEGECVIWVWLAAGQATAGDYRKGKARDAAKNYEPIKNKPTHWMPWPNA